MRLPCMIICFNREMSEKLDVGLIAAFSAHAAMWMDRLMSGNAQIATNKYGTLFGDD